MNQQQIEDWIEEAKCCNNTFNVEMCPVCVADAICDAHKMGLKTTYGEWVPANGFKPYRDGQYLVYNGSNGFFFEHLKAHTTQSGWTANILIWSEPEPFPMPVNLESEFKEWLKANVPNRFKEFI